ncbi:MAG: hypothetical protein COB22_05070 [Cycloclasticus sp.]|nr:MAG: hypothetical protein COB22_05070 [Cycloclasticus sp.]
MITLFSKSKIFQMEMGFTRTEFIKLLDHQNKLSYKRDANRVCFSFLDKEVIVNLMEEGIRRIASAEIPMLTVGFDCSGMEKSEQEQFLKLFLRTFHKGGG